MRTFLLALIITGLAGLLAPADPGTPVGRLGVLVRRASLFVVIFMLVFVAATAVMRPEALFDFG